MAIELVNILNVSREIQIRVVTWRNKDRVRTQMVNQELISLKQHEQWLGSLKGRTETDKYFVVHVDKAPMGMMYLTDLDENLRTAQWGFYIGEDSYLGKGYGKQMLTKLLDIFFEDMGYQTLITEVLASNKVAIEMYNNFKFEETKRMAFGSNNELLTLKFDRTQWRSNHKIGI